MQNMGNLQKPMVPLRRTNKNGNKESRYVIESETIEYLKNVEKLLDENNFNDPEEREILIQNALTEIDGTEIRLMSHNYCSEVLEKLVQQSTASHIVSFLSKLQGQYWQLSRKRFASHVLQTALGVASKWINQEQFESKLDQNDLRSVVLGFAAEFEPNAADALSDTYASHVLRSLTILLSGKVSLDEQYLVSNSSKHFKSQNKLTQKKEQYDYFVPTVFAQALRNIAQAVMMNNQPLEELAQNPISSPTLQVLLLCTGKSERESFIKRLFSGKNEQDRQSLLLRLAQDKIGSHFLQIMLKCISQRTFSKCFQTVFKGNLSKLLIYPSGLYVLRDIISCIAEKDLMKDMLDELQSILSALKSGNHTIILVKIVAKCSELQKCFKAALRLVHSYYDIDESNLDASIGNSLQKIDLNRSLIVQSIFTFPPKYSQPYFDFLLRTSPDKLLSMATDGSSSHLIEGFFKGTASKDQKIEMYDKFIGNFHKLAGDKYASHLVQTIWAQLPIACKKLIATELKLHKKLVEDSKYGCIIMHEFRIEKFAHRPEEWESDLKTLDKKRKVLQEFLDE